MKKRFVLILLAILLLSGCGPLQEKTEKIQIVATIFPLYDFAREIAGEDAEVKMLLTPGAEVHSYEPTPQHIIAIQNCDVFLYIGGEHVRMLIVASLDNLTEAEVLVVSKNRKKDMMNSFVFMCFSIIVYTGDIQCHKETRHCRERKFQLCIDPCFQ